MFKDQFKYFKSKTVKYDPSKVINFNKTPPDKIPPILVNQNLNLDENLGLKAIHLWQAYELQSHPGLIFIRNPFTCYGQRYWIAKCLEVYTQKPNKSNLDAFDYLSGDEDWWTTVQLEKPQLMNKMRWVTLGYHHNWDTKIYSEKSKGKMPADLTLLTKTLATALNYHNFFPEAAIVNYYHMDSTLSGHTDHSEQNLTAPLFSISFGQSAIFMIGGPTIEDASSAVLIESGDVVVMSGQSRLCYHGVPKILQASNEPWNCDTDSTEDLSTKRKDEEKYFEDNFWTPFGCYVKRSRINLNVRQVLNDGQISLL